MNIQIAIQNECVSVVASDLDFGSQGVLDANIDAVTSVTLTCTSGTDFDVGLSPGAAAGASASARSMTSAGGGSEVIGYALFSDAARTKNWGATSGTDTVTGTGTGSSQRLDVYGRVPPQTTPAAGAYRDTVQVTLTY